jgi:hypothetical protein
MKRRRLASGTDSRRVLGAMIVDAEVCLRIAEKWEPPGLFRSEHANLVGSWCINHVRKYGRAIGSDINTKFYRWSEKRGDEDTLSELIGQLLENTLDDWNKLGEGGSFDYLLDLAGKVFNRDNLHRLNGNLDLHLDTKSYDNASKAIREYKTIELGKDEIIKPGLDFECWVDALDSEEEQTLIRYPGAVGKFLGNEFSRDSFVCFMGTAKRGKSWWLVDVTYRGVKQRRRVAYFEAGDLSRRQVLRRLGQRGLMRPKRDGVCAIPITYDDQEEGPVVEEEERSGISPRTCFAKWKKLQRGQDRFRLSCNPNNSLSAEAILSNLQSWEREGWVADIVVIDYADLLTKPFGASDNREGINENWKMLRRISQEFHCCVVTATQSDAAGYKQKVLSRTNFSDDRRKHDHVTAMLGINVTDKEKGLGISRLNWLDRREEEFTEGKQVHVAGCLGIGCVAMKSCF